MFTTLQIRSDVLKSNDPERIFWEIQDVLENEKPIKETLNTNKDRFREFLKEKNYRITEERIAIHKRVFEYKEKFNVDDLYFYFFKTSYIISRATIYSTVKLLVEFKLINPIPQVNRSAITYKRA